MFIRHKLVLTLGVLLLLAGGADAKRPGAKVAEPTPPPGEIMHLVAKDCTIPRQTLCLASEGDPKLDGRPPVEIWFKYRIEPSGQKNIQYVYSTIVDSLTIKTGKDIVDRLILRIPPDSAHPEKWFYHRVVLLSHDQTMQLDSHAIPTPGDLPGVIAVSDSDGVPAEIKARFRPELPPYLKEQGFKGSVLLKIRVSKEGKAELVEIQSSCGNSNLDQIVKAAAYKNLYKPAMRNGVPETGWLSDRVEISYERDNKGWSL